MSISLNSVAKFKTRVLPSLLAYQQQEGDVPPLLVLSLATLIHFYKGEQFGSEIKLNDDPQAIAFLQDLWQKQTSGQLDFAAMTTAILGWEYAWGQDLNEITSLPKMLQTYLAQIEQSGMKITLSIAQKTS